MSHGYTDAELALLSDEEREGLLSQADDDTTELETDGLPENADGTDALVAKPEVAKPSAALDQVEPAAAAVAAEAAAAVIAAAATPVVEDIVPTPAKYVLPPADLDTKINSAREEQLALATKFDEGDLSALEFQKQNRVLDDQIANFRETKLKATMSFDAKVDEWLNVTAPAWLDKDEYNHYRTNPGLFEQLNEQVKKLQETTFQSNIFDPRIMDVAHAKLVETFRQMLVQTPGAKPSVPGRVMPPNIGALPQAGEDDLNDGGRFAHLDRLLDNDYLGWEAELAKLSPADRDAYNAAR